MAESIYRKATPEEEAEFLEAIQESVDRHASERAKLQNNAEPGKMDWKPASPEAAEEHQEMMEAGKADAAARLKANRAGR
jgi:hypothetical protein